MKDDHRKVKMLEQMLQYNLNRDAGPHTLARLRKELKEAQDALAKRMSQAMAEWYDIYREEQRRGKGGGSNEGKANNAALKQVLKDNRIRETKWTEAEKDAYFEALKLFEEEHGKLDRLSRRP